MDAIALSRSLLEQSRIESDLARLVRSYVSNARELLLERHRGGAGGMEVVAAYSTMMDQLIGYLFRHVSENFIRRYPTQSPRCTVIAQGGYGRGELNPHSDVDLLFLYTWKITPYVESIAETILYTLWDAGVQVGHATRNTGESMRLANQDMKVRTSLLDARYLCGDYQLYGDFDKSVKKRLIKRRIDRFVREKLEESRVRRASFGGSVYLLEPEVKEGEGGLRDIHTALWIARVKQDVKDLDALVQKGILSQNDLGQLKSALDFLLRVRNELHFSSGKHQDQLTFEEQEKVSQALGFEGEGTLKAVEVFMRNYYLQASQVSRLTSLIIHRLTECARPLFGMRYPTGKTIREGVRVSNGHLYISNAEILSSDPGNMIRVFADMQKHRCAMTQETHELMREHLDLIDDRFRRSAAANLPFFAILKWKERVYETLVEMHRCGVLGAFVPEFGRLLCMVLHDAYHIYTVDQHSLRLIKELEKLKTGGKKETLPLLTQIAREAEKIELLYLGLIFHDIGKGYGGGHSEIGSRMVRSIARRMRLNVDDTALVEMLVRHHLLMSHTAFRRDLDDEKTIVDFAQTMGSIINLKMLYLLTYADIRAVGPDVWNNWKGSLLAELYLKTLTVLEEMEKGEFQREDRRATLRRIHGRIRRRLSKDFPPQRVSRFLDSMPDRYFFSTPESDVPSHFRLMEEFDGEGSVSDVQHFPEKDYSEMMICTRDRPGLFASITGVLAALGLDILNARIFTSEDGRILDVFRISHSGRADIVMAAQKWARVRSMLNGVLEGSLDVARLMQNSERSALFQKRTPKVSTAVQVDNEASDDFTIVEVYTSDRTGVLFTITYALHQLKISIHLAKISTNVDQVADVFYVTGDSGEKITAPARIEQLRQTLQERLVREDERVAEPLH